MEYLSKELLLSIAVVVCILLVIVLTSRAIRKFGKMGAIDMNKRKVIFYLNYFIIYLMGGIALAIIWGINVKEFTVFISSVLAILGVGFFAQWSILSNLTASVILFFSHPLRLGDRIRVQDKDFNWTGVVEDISGFYLFMRTDDGRRVTIPTNLVMQKGIEILEGNAA